MAGAEPLGRTVFGMPSPLRSAPQAPGAEAAEPAAPGPEALPAKTLFGVPSPLAPAPGRPPTPAPGPEALPAKTLFGVPSPLAPTMRSGPPPGTEPSIEAQTLVDVPALEGLRAGGALRVQQTLPGLPARAEIAPPGRTLAGGPAREPRVPGVPARPPEQAAPPQVPRPRAAVSAPGVPPGAQPALPPAGSPFPLSDPGTAAPPGRPSPVRPTPRPDAAPAAQRSTDDLRAGATPPPESAADSAPRDRRAAERYAAARIAAAVAEEERRAAQVRLRRALVALLAVALVATIAAVLLVRERRGFRAELAGDVSVRRAGDRLEVSVGVFTSSPADVVHAGGSTAVNGSAEVAFAVPVAETRVGTNPISMRAVPREGGEPRTLTLNVVVYYRFVTPTLDPPRPGVPIRLDVEVMEGFTPAVEGGVVHAEGANRYRVEIEPGPTLAAAAMTDRAEADLPVRLVLTGPDGEQRTFSESLRLPLPATPLRVIGPPHGWARAADRVRVRGRTVGGAEVRLGDVAVAPDAQGDFQVVAPLPSDGRHTLVLQVRAPGHRTTEAEVQVERVSAAIERQRAEERRARARDFLAGAGALPPYATLVATPGAFADRRVRIVGEVVESRRGDDGRNELQVVTCAAAGGCLYWVDVDGPLGAEPGDRVLVAGTLDGVHSYTARTGEALTVPKLRAAVVDR